MYLLFKKLSVLRPVNKPNNFQNTIKPELLNLDDTSSRENCQSNPNDDFRLGAADPLAVFPNRLERSQVAGIENVFRRSAILPCFKLWNASLALTATNCSTLGSR
jgi:hypothetical protein